MNAAAPAAKPRSLTPLLLLVALFALPPLAAWLFFFNVITSYSIHYTKLYDGLTNPVNLCLP